MGLPGEEFVRFGHRVAWRLLRKGKLRLFVETALPPVMSMRHFEFPYVWSNMFERAATVLDVSSPRLFSLYAASLRPAASFTLWNPDPKDIQMTAEVAAGLSLPNVQTAQNPVVSLRASAASYECIYAISVVEHIEGDDYSDSEAVLDLWNALESGGRLILTVPVARSYSEQYQDSPSYPTQPFAEGKGYFFQRWYDPPSLETRLLAHIPGSCDMKWFGEVDAGIYDRYQYRLKEEGRRARATDPILIAKHFCEFARWQDMPGMGVCGLTIHKSR